MDDINVQRYKKEEEKWMRAAGLFVKYSIVMNQGKFKSSSKTFSFNSVSVIKENLSQVQNIFFQFYKRYQGKFKSSSKTFTFNSTSVLNKVNLNVWQACHDLF
jgi:hypothetical protein